MDNKTYTKGDVIVEDIKVGDIHYEFGYGMGLKVEVITLPVAVDMDEGDTYWEWTSKCVHTGRIIEYGVHSKYSHYGPNLYTHEAYAGCRYPDGTKSLSKYVNT